MTGGSSTRAQLRCRCASTAWVLELCPPARCLSAACAPRGELGSARLQRRAALSALPSAQAARSAAKARAPLVAVALVLVPHPGVPAPPNPRPPARSQTWEQGAAA